MTVKNKVLITVVTFALMMLNNLFFDSAVVGLLFGGAWGTFTGILWIREINNLTYRAAERIWG